MDLRFWRSQTDIRREFRYVRLSPALIHAQRRQRFSFSLIPLGLFYSSFTKLFFLFLLTIWQPSRVPPLSPNNYDVPLPFNLEFDILGATEFMTDDREWVVRNVLGGMSAGFGLRGE